jgi:hypothetical protein
MDAVKHIAPAMLGRAAALARQVLGPLKGIALR